MENINKSLESFQNLLERSKNNQELIKELYLNFQNLSKNIVALLPANDIKESIAMFNEGFERGNISLDKLSEFISRVKFVIFHLQKQLPLGINSREQLKEIRALVMDALHKAVEKFEKNFGTKLPPIEDTKVFIVGSRVRGFSHDNERAFAPGRDVDVLLVGNGIAESELKYLEIKGFDKIAKRVKEEGFLATDNSRFIPPFLAKTAETISKIFEEGDKLFGKTKKAIINYHIGTLKSKQVLSAIETGIECI